MCLYKKILSLIILLGGLFFEIAWLGVCFGTVIIGIILLIFAPHILLAPFSIGLAMAEGATAHCD